MLCAQRCPRSIRSRALRRAPRPASNGGRGGDGCGRDSGLRERARSYCGWRSRLLSSHLGWYSRLPCVSCISEVVPSARIERRRALCVRETAPGAGRSRLEGSHEATVAGKHPASVPLHLPPCGPRRHADRTPHPQAQLAPFQISEGVLSSAVQRMTEGPVPLAHWTGYAAVMLVSAKAIRPWTVTVSDVQNAIRKSLIFPRRWLDLHGRKLEQVWEAALRSVLGLVLLRPGMSQVRARSSFAPTLVELTLTLNTGTPRRRSGGGYGQCTTARRCASCCRRCTRRAASLRGLMLCTGRLTSGLRTRARRSTPTGSWRATGGVGTRCSSFPSKKLRTRVVLNAKRAAARRCACLYVVL